MVDTDLKLNSATFSTKQIKDEELGDGERNLILSLTAKNIGKSKPGMRFDTFQPKLTDVDGVEVEWSGAMLAASRDADIDTTLDPAQEMNFRYYFKVPKDVQLKSLSLEQSGSRAYTFDMSGVK
jgi:hypothetical protein